MEAHCLAAADYEIAGLCRYIKDNGTIANYFGVDRGRVERIRKRMMVMRYRKESAGTSRHINLPEPVNDRSPCSRCGVRRDVGCRHSQAEAVL